ncbi:MAG: TlpA disulfide reductase family protein [bacterium]
MKVLLSTIISFIFTCSLVAQQVTVTGTAPGAEKKTIRLLTWGDLITFVEKPVAQTTIDSTGSFSMTFNLPSTSYIAVSIDLHRSELYMQPGSAYEMKIAPINYTDNLEVNPFILSQNLEIELVNPGQDELNVWIRAYDDKYNQFLLDHFNALYLERKKTWLDTFQLQVNNLYAWVHQPYLQNYIRYKTAGLEQIAHAKSQADLAKTYFIDQPILYENVEYMQFFNNFFTKYLPVTSNVLRKIDLNPIIRGPKPYPALMKTLASDTILRNEQLRELVLLKGLYELFYADKESQDYIIGILGTIKLESKVEKNRAIAENMYKKVTQLRSGTEAPEFTLVGRKNDERISLKDFAGKPVVLNFWTTFCEGCLAEMELEVPIYEKYKDKVVFASICADKYWIKMNYYAMVKPEFAWVLLHYSDNTDLLVDYNVRSYPLYLIIDRDGDIYRYPAPMPSEGLEAVIEELIQQ